MKNHSPRVTVLMPVYNGERYLRQAIDSILQQTFEDFEFLIINDGSTDSSVEIINSYRDPRIRLVLNDQNLKLIATLNKGLELARGEYIARMDSDDISLPQRLAKQVEFMDHHPEIGVCGTMVKVIGRLYSYIWDIPTEPDEIKARLFFSNALAHPAVMIRREKLLEFNLWYETDRVHAEDYALWQRCSFLFPLANLPQVLLCYRIFQGSISSKYAAAQAETLKQIHRTNLKYLGVEINPANLETHWSTVLFAGARDRDLLIKAESWLQELRLSNSRAKRYPEPAFTQAVCRHWFALCNATTCLGIPAIRLFFTSQLYSKASISKSQLLKFLVKCIIRWDYRCFLHIKKLIAYK